jgi:hypothetical protein
VERAEAKVFANRERYKNFSIKHPLRRAYGKLFTFSGNYQDALLTRQITLDGSVEEWIDLSGSVGGVEEDGGSTCTGTVTGSSAGRADSRETYG